MVELYDRLKAYVKAHSYGIGWPDTIPEGLTDGYQNSVSALNLALVRIDSGSMYCHLKEMYAPHMGTVENLLKMCETLPEEEDIEKCLFSISEIYDYTNKMWKEEYRAFRRGGGPFKDPQSDIEEMEQYALSIDDIHGLIGLPAPTKDDFKALWKEKKIGLKTQRGTEFLESTRKLSEPYNPLTQRILLNILDRTLENEKMLRRLNQV